MLELPQPEWHTVLLHYLAIIILLGHTKLILCFSDRKNPDGDLAGWHGKEKTTTHEYHDIVLILLHINFEAISSTRRDIEPSCPPGTTDD